MTFERVEVGQRVLRPALRYRGGKWRIAPWIVSHLPRHECYVEPFMGACSVLLQKRPSDFEAMNDLDGLVVAFFRVLRERPADLKHAILLTPCAREELRRAYDPIPAGHPDPDLERARRLYMRCWQGRGSTSRRSGWRFQTGWTGWAMNYPRLFKSLGHLGPIAERLALVQIEQDDALACIRRWDAPGTLFYVDPPYPLSTRERSPDLYANEPDDAYHEQIAETLHGIHGMAVVSGYPGPLYDRLYSSWRCEMTRTYAEQQRAVTEALWISPSAERGIAQQVIFQNHGPEVEAAGQLKLIP